MFSRSNQSYVHNFEEVPTSHFGEDDEESIHDINQRLFGPDEFGSGCPAECGCPKTKKDCPRQYSISDIEASASAQLSIPNELYFSQLLETMHLENEKYCQNFMSAGMSGGVSGSSGGWCLGHRNTSKEWSPMKLPDGRTIQIPDGHVPVSPIVSTTLENFILKENVTSMNDFGAGVGQYGVYLQNKNFSNLVYRGYDGAGDIEAYTSGFLNYADLTIPLNFPVAEWVLSLEVGEHVPSKFKGMLIRNLHPHNCQGVILIWAILGQLGENHINNHSNDYVAAIFEQLNYRRDMFWEQEFCQKQSHTWFEKSSMVFQRLHPTC